MGNGKTKEKKPQHAPDESPEESNNEDAFSANIKSSELEVEKKLYQGATGTRTFPNTASVRRFYA